MTHPMEFPIEPAWQVLLKDLGARPADVLRRAGLPEDLFSRPEPRLSTERYFRLWQSLEAEVADPLFPLRLAEVVTTEAFTPPLFAAMCSPNLRVAARRLQQYKRLIAPMALHLEETRGGLRLRFAWLAASSPPPPSLSATEIAFLVRLVRIATRSEVRPLKVEMPVPPAPAAAYRRFFGVSVERGPQLAVTFARADLERPFLTANEGLWATFEPELRRRLAELTGAATMAEKVRAALHEALPGGMASMEAVAGRLAISKRTLQRRLQDEGTSFQALMAETREALARHYLQNTALSCMEISFLLGFEDPNSFFRAFHGWTGNTPESLRQQLAG